MLKGFVRGLRRSGLLPKGRPDIVVLLNHNPADPKAPGDVSFFTSVDALVHELRAIDLQEGGYYAVDSTGRVVTMQARGQDPDDRIDAVMARHASEAQLAQRLIKHFLLCDLEEESDHAPDAKRRHLIEREHSTERLMELVPDRVFEGA
ncbi:MAG: hypothetical protein AB7L90_02555 [Hyphomicrobiaceae bacterium]